MRIANKNSTIPFKQRPLSYKIKTVFAVSITTVFIILAISTLIAERVVEAEYKKRTNETLMSEMNKMGFPSSEFTAPITYCSHGQKQVELNPLQSCYSDIELHKSNKNFIAMNERAKLNHWVLINAHKGTPDEGWLYFSEYRKAGMCLILREIDGPNTTKVSMAKNKDC